VSSSGLGPKLKRLANNCKDAAQSAKVDALNSSQLGTTERFMPNVDQTHVSGHRR
jgi:hypothetical protein